MKRSVVWGLAVVVAFSLMPGLSYGARAKIARISHQHPTGKDYSYICAKVGGKAGRTYKLTMIGPEYPNGKTRKIRIRGSRLRRVSYAINSPGRYDFEYTRGGRTIDEKSYVVPSPDADKRGPFPCKG